MSDSIEDNIEWQVAEWVRDHPQGSPLTASPKVEAPQLHAKLLRERKDAYTEWALELAARDLRRILKAARAKGH